jgi:hypothetical protein
MISSLSRIAGMYKIRIINYALKENERSKMAAVLHNLLHYSVIPE